MMGWAAFSFFNKDQDSGDDCFMKSLQFLVGQ